MPGPLPPESISQFVEQTRTIGLVFETLACAGFAGGVLLLAGWVAGRMGHAVRTLGEAVDFGARHPGGAALSCDRQHGATVTPNNSDGSSRA